MPAPQAIWIKRGGGNGTGNNGPTGRKTRPAARMYRALAEMAAAHNVIHGVKKSDYIELQKKWMAAGSKHYYEFPGAAP